MFLHLYKIFSVTFCQKVCVLCSKSKLGWTTDWSMTDIERTLRMKRRCKACNCRKKQTNCVNLFSVADGCRQVYSIFMLQSICSRQFRSGRSKRSGRDEKVLWKELIFVAYLGGKYMKKHPPTYKMCYATLSGYLTCNKNMSFAYSQTRQINFYAEIFTQRRNEQFKNDASDQKYEPMTFLRRKFSGAERHWSRVEKEVYAIFRNSKRLTYFFLAELPFHLFKHHQNFL